MWDAVWKSNINVEFTFLNTSNIIFKGTYTACSWIGRMNCIAVHLSRKSILSSKLRNHFLFYNIAFVADLNTALSLGITARRWFFFSQMGIGRIYVAYTVRDVPLRHDCLKKIIYECMCYNYPVLATLKLETRFFFILHVTFVCTTKNSLYKNSQLNLLYLTRESPLFGKLTRGRAVYLTIYKFWS